MNWQFWIGTLSAVLNVLFIVDFVCYMLAGESLGAFVFGDGSSLADVMLERYPDMTASEFLAANGILLAASACLMLFSIWVAYASSGVIVDHSGCSNRRGRL